ncbi:hypothetical protein A6X20_02030 [Bradyrhizobium elkanii]|nr:hypothetical protein A6452_17320 [Bradyrhizobium elkanii]ODM86432.1 hypothetical protein A6X20_02030 [Bradyrhizobium elkanii]
MGLAGASDDDTQPSELGMVRADRRVPSGSRDDTDRVDVTTISPMSPGATGSPMLGLTIFRIRSSLTVTLSRAGVSKVSLAK